MVEWINDVPLDENMDKIESQLGFSLPDDLMKTISAHNKGQPRPNKIPLGNGKYAEFYRLLSFNQNDNLSVMSCYDDEMKSKRIFPFAITENGSYICLKDNSVILYNVAHDAEKYLCNSFSDLIESLSDSAD